MGVAFLELTLERGQDRGSGGGVLLHFFAIATDDVAPPRQHDRLGLVVDLLAPLGDGEWDVGHYVLFEPPASKLFESLLSLFCFGCSAYWFAPR